MCGRSNVSHGCLLLNDLIKTLIAFRKRAEIKTGVSEGHSDISGNLESFCFSQTNKVTN